MIVARQKIIIISITVFGLIVLFPFHSGYVQESPFPGKPAARELQNNNNSAYTGNIPVYTYNIVKIYPHDSRAFTQGLFYDQGFFYEGTGLPGKSDLRKVTPETGKTIKNVKLSAGLFGEGVTLCNDYIIQLTWRAGKGFVYDKVNFKLLNEFQYSGEGWGATCDGNNLIVSNGTNILSFLDPRTYKKTGQMKVYADRKPVTNLNELEYIRGNIYANVWRTDLIAIIDPKTGKVNSWIDLEGLTLRTGGDKYYKTLNGIAYDAETGRLFVTGKLWPEIYEIELVPLE